MKWSTFALYDEAQAFAELGSSANGLTEAKAEQRILENQAFRIEEDRLSIFKILVRQLRSSFVYLLLVAAILSLFFGERFEALLIFVFISINAILQTYQEYHSEKSVRLLKRYLTFHSRVRRGGVVVTIESDQTVPGDVVLFSAGDRLPADVRFTSVNGLEIDESVITGESIAVEKRSSVMAVMPSEMYEASNIGFAGTIVTAGRGEGVVFAVGKETSLGSMSRLVEEPVPETSFEYGIREFSQFILKLVFFTIAIIFVANVLIKGSQVDISELLVFSLVLAVSVVPEALPAVLTVSLSRGSMKLAQKKVVVKRLSSIEDLGSIEVLCTDKTGTITENILSVSSVSSAHERVCLSLAFSACLEEPKEEHVLHDAFDIALWRALSEKERVEALHRHRLDSIPFDPDRRRNSVLIHSDAGREIIVRGAPEEILKRSSDVDQFALKRSSEFVAEAGRRGERVIAVARRAFPEDREYNSYEEQQLSFVGLIAFADTIKDTAQNTIERAKALHVEVKIITGDSREVAGSVGYAIGLLSDPLQVVTGKELDALSYDERRAIVASNAVFARISPKQKHDIIRILQEKRIVGFLGEGINDAPALRLANVGIVVNGATDIAREAADIVLLEKNLGTVIDGIKEGRVIFANILKYLRITLTSNFGNFYSVAVASLFIPFVPLLPAQVLLIDLLSDFPMLAIATDRVDSEELENPKRYDVKDVVLTGTILGAVSSVFDFIVFGMYAHVSPGALQTAWFFLSAFTEIILIFSLRSKHPFFRMARPATMLIVLAMIVTAIVAVLPFIGMAREAFSFIYPPTFMLPTIIGISIAYFFATEAMKRLYYRHTHLVKASALKA